MCGGRPHEGFLASKEETSVRVGVHRALAAGRKGPVETGNSEPAAARAPTCVCAVPCTHVHEYVYMHLNRNAHTNMCTNIYPHSSRVVKGSLTAPKPHYPGREA